jgi:hypothetical protein
MVYMVRLCGPWLYMLMYIINTRICESERVLVKSGGTLRLCMDIVCQYGLEITPY